MSTDGFGFDWSDASALYQVEHGEPGSDRTESAFDHLEQSVNGGQGDDTTRDIGLSLLGLVERLRNAGG